MEESKYDILQEIEGSQGLEEDSSPKKEETSAYKENAVIRYMFSTRAGLNYFKKKKENQDALIISRRLLGYKQIHFFGVCDGHGVNGRKVSHFVTDQLAGSIKKELKGILKEEGLSKENIKPIMEGVKKAHILTNLELCSLPGLDTRFSGTTCCNLLFLGRTILVSNVGDSRAIVGRFANGKWSAHPLTCDHKPEDPLER